MKTEEFLKTKETQELIKIANTPAEEYSKMSYKEKQAIFRAKNKLCKVIFRGGTYKKRKKVK